MFTLMYLFVIACLDCVGKSREFFTLLRSLIEITGLDKLLNFLSISVSYEKVRCIIILLIQKEEYYT